ncbi:dihydrofolate reductase [Lacticaseibacillus pantheris]|jgi:dihydrofolate reductase|uniref:Dihydrofolate reductase n=1 Tax=Lacticaseibacillus pantheris DSM 15945 = JCM 12539 = NBRC 106106 TaxID=1423783 RepID=A0A0R1TY06_9LACO|nr:dihydrofolate reductase [Lacticaseibacillus pantheris]KRL86076.1 dihydrofolate reductase [Lacticaseibacillus pantheris DSM 15945 = JCM 12539 = NBRC 106106]WKF85194.1 dihydrofolate reductase [Lacticaseibacillus pantheris]
METAFIWAQDRNRIIGRDGKLPWHLSDDLQFFKATTLNQAIIMGRKTFVGMGSRPLPQRLNIVLTHQQDLAVPDGVLVVHSIQEALAAVTDAGHDTAFVIGGAGVFNSFVEAVGNPDRLFVTRIHGAVEGDTKMVELAWSQYRRESARTVNNADPQLTHTFEEWVYAPIPPHTSEG